MSQEAINTIRVHKWKMTKRQAEKFAQNYVDIIQNAYPIGIEDTDNETYFVLPGFEHVTKHQPVVAYHPTQGMWELQTRDKFLLPKI